MTRKLPGSTICLLALLLVTLGMIQLYGCGGGGSGLPTYNSIPATGVVQTAITDARAFGTFSSVHVRINKVLAVPAGQENAADTDSSLPILATFPVGVDVNILSLHFLPQVLGNALVPAGNYTQIRLILAPNAPTLNNYVTLAGNPSPLPLTTPSAQQTGLKIVGNFTVVPGKVNTVLLDFNPNAAIVITGKSKVLLKPTGIRILQVFNSLSNAGAVTGQIRAFSRWSTATVSVVPRNPSGTAVSSGTIFSNFSSPGVWSAPFTVFLPPNGSAAMPSANYKLFVQAFGSGAAQNATFQVYSSPLFTITPGVDTVLPTTTPGTVLLTP